MSWQILDPCISMVRPSESHWKLAVVCSAQLDLTYRDDLDRQRRRRRASETRSGEMLETRLPGMNCVTISWAIAAGGERTVT